MPLRPRKENTKAVAVPAVVRTWKVVRIRTWTEIEFTHVAAGSKADAIARAHQANVQWTETQDLRSGTKLKYGARPQKPE